MVAVPSVLVGAATLPDAEVPSAAVPAERDEDVGPEVAEAGEEEPSESVGTTPPVEDISGPATSVGVERVVAGCGSIAGLELGATVPAGVPPGGLTVDGVALPAEAEAVRDGVVVGAPGGGVLFGGAGVDVGGFAVPGFDVLGFAVLDGVGVGFEVLGLAVVGFAVVGFAVVG